MLGGQLLGGLGLVLGLEGVKDLKDLAALAQGLDDVLRVRAGAVHIALMAVVHLDAEALHGLGELGLKMLGIVLVAAPGVGDVHVGSADVLVIGIAHGGLNVCGDLAATVKIVPGEEQAGALTLFLESLADKQGGGDVAEIADVNRARGADAGGADVFLLVGISVNELLCDLF